MSYALMRDPVKSKQALARALRQIRDREEMTQEDLAHAAGVHVTWISRLGRKTTRTTCGGRPYGRLRTAWGLRPWRSWRWPNASNLTERLTWHGGRCLPPLPLPPQRQESLQLSRQPLVGAPAARYSAAMDPAQSAYESFAPIYDRFNHRTTTRCGSGPHAGAGEARAAQGAAAGYRLRDRPSLRADAAPRLEVVGCDLTPAMLEEAQRKYGDAAPTIRPIYASCRSSESSSSVWALNDVVNYLLEDGDLQRAFAGMRANLAPDGLILFDADTLSPLRVELRQR